MIDKIKNLRIEIDGLSQLVKELKPNYCVDLNKLPKEYSIDEIVKIMKNAPVVIIDTKENNSKTIIQEIKSKELEKCYDSLVLAKAWLGKILGELNVPSPYQNDGNRSEIKDIEPTADTANLYVENWTWKNIQDRERNIKNKDKEMNYIEKIDWLREIIEVFVLRMKDFISPLYKPSDMTKEFWIARTNTYNYLCEARFWLGFELQRIKENGL